MSASSPIVLCTLRYSENLGDGVLGDSMEYLIKQNEPNREVRHLDMAGRQRFSAGGEEHTSKLKAVFYSAPGFLRPLMTKAQWHLKAKKKVQSAWQEIGLQHPFNLVFGGGQMFSDLALNFPLKFDLVRSLALKDKANIAISSVGVSSNWSKEAKSLFGLDNNLDKLAYLSVRDAQSRENLTRHYPSLASFCRETVDAAVYTAEAYGLSSDYTSRESNIVGLGVSHPSELASYSNDADAFTQNSMAAYWMNMTQEVVKLGKIPVLFTNGSTEDEIFLDYVQAHLDRSGTPYKRAKRPRIPKQLVETIYGFSSVISHRLHANIIAYSLGIPSVALNWDPKVKAFAALSGREKWCAEPGMSVLECVSLMVDAIKDGVNYDRRTELQKIAREEVAMMLSSLDGKVSV